MAPPLPHPAPAGPGPAGQPARLGPGRQGYVAGFLLDDADRVVLVRKLRPAWQAGALNGVGGKIEAGESPAQAMRREFAEETGVDLDTWDHLVTLTFDAGTVWFFRRFADPDVLDAVRSVTDEHIGVYPVVDVLRADSAVISNLRWLLPLATHRDERYAPILVRQRAGIGSETS